MDPDGTTCGVVEIRQPGSYGLLACYADDPQTDTDEGALPGDEIQLLVDAVVLAQGVWTGNGERERLVLGEWKNTDIYLPLLSQGRETEASEGREHAIYVPVITQESTHTENESAVGTDDNATDVNLLDYWMWLP